MKKQGLFVVGLSLLALNGCSTTSEKKVRMCLGEPCIQERKPVEKPTFYVTETEENYTHFDDGSVSSHKLEKGLYRLREYFNRDGSIQTREAKFLDPERGSLNQKLTGRQLKFNGDGFVASAEYGYNLEFNEPTQFDNFWLKESESLYGLPKPAFSANDDYIAILYANRENQYTDYGARFGIVNLEKPTCSVSNISNTVYGKVYGRDITFSQHCAKVGNKVALIYKPASKADAQNMINAIIRPIARAKVVDGVKLEKVYIEVQGKRVSFDVRGWDQYFIKNGENNGSPYRLF
ncbi:hypothetical protein P3602_24515 [Vibrio parahaemolyticus]|uniref:hypothetical protein n=1 Tax=unclassified Vibrio TaxID=2614977 RepID=UPI0023ECA9CB|nr:MULTISPECIES: hypothetical protein [unclassified Vibrio]MDF5109080.1 hypothetical protein [Vibrio parahaemolyticus]MDF5143982.1 hypothetical protein [Vibrio parahaemolyticus]MDF5154409.1 hypothetical protein [Vibrio parahaemolyticus]MDW1567443.1 hypothetical protein [Vibrio sp. YT-15]MDW1928909.1 hypothetical protein [Vibrio sp. 947]